MALVSPGVAEKAGVELAPGKILPEASVTLNLRAESTLGALW